MTPGSAPRHGIMFSLVNRVSAAGTAVIVLVGVALAAIVEEQISPTGRSQRATATPGGPRSTASRRPATSRSARHRKPPNRAALLERQVRRVTLAERGSAVRREYGTAALTAPVVRTTRMGGRRTWAFGTEAIPPPATATAVPESSLFIAHATGHTWKVALAGTPGFVALSRQAPASVLPPGERAVLRRYGASAKPAALMLPWTVGQSWTVLPMDHGLAFDGGDGRVLAATAGRLYRICSASRDRGLVLVIGSGGTAAQYYQLDRLTKVADGGLVRRGDYLGRTSTDQPCGGGAADRRLVRFGLRDAAGPIPLNGVNLGGWTLHQSATAMYAEREGLRVKAGNPLLNFGIDLVPAAPAKPHGGGGLLPELRVVHGRG